MGVESDVMVPMRDGIALATDIYFPTTDGKRAPGRYPCILERTPYGKGEPSRSERDSTDTEPLTRREVAGYFVKNGYVVIYQDCRGRHKSGGEFTKYLDDANDGYDTCRWITSQGWSDGTIATKGLSYAAHTQMAAASAGAPGLRAMVVDSGGFSNGFQSGIRQGGAYELKQAAWAVMFAAEHAGLELSPEDLDRWFKRMPWRRGHSPLTPTPQYEEFLFDQWERGSFDEFWKQPGIYAQGYYPQLWHLPVIHISSWYDVYSRTAIENFSGTIADGAPKRLILGPWTHGNRWETYAGDVDFGPAARFEGNLAPSLLEFRRRWFDRWLKGCCNGANHEPPVMLFVMGGGTGRKNADGRLDHGGCWRAEEQWPIPSTEKTTLHLHADGTLATTRPTEPRAAREYVFDPLDPVPTIGGSVVSRPPAIFAGGFDQVERADFFGCKSPGRPLADRHDVLVFQTAPLQQDLEVTGDIEVVLHVSTNCPDTDFTAKLIDVYPPSADYPQGYALNLTDGIIRARYRDSWESPELLQPGAIYRVTVRMLPTSNLFKRGHRIRLDISSSNFPKFDVNPNTGEAEARAQRTQPASNRIHMDSGSPSYVVLPIVPKAERT
ncbi:CocE/NonD family hydrolase [Ramlibacter tataouinensis]|uniref:Antibiotic hydrolase n=1 Tax=Ramlibacter tataouinensis TaxID=94132 RepID=A0A127JRL5_9BURK|nr:CocE/NonD family hydrolase [Ramlibacter tataouinensis]AMO22674.1 antibiotic hydrolase [Ramlibacter tataouinensis]